MAKVIAVEIPGLKLRSRCQCKKLGTVACIGYSRQERGWRVIVMREVGTGRSQEIGDQSLSFRFSEEILS